MLIDSRAQRSVFDFFSSGYPFASCSSSKTFFNTSFLKQSAWNCFDICNALVFIKILFWNHSSLLITKRVYSLILFYNAHKQTNLYIQLRLSRHCWEKCFLYNNTDADYHLNPLHKNWSFPLRISSVNVTESAISSSWKLQFFVQWSLILRVS